MDFCDLSCKYASFPTSEAVDGSRSCRTFIALYCKKEEVLSTRTFPAGIKSPFRKKRISAFRDVDPFVGSVRLASRSSESLRSGRQLAVKH
jgi:hypothetical protein